MTNILLGIIAVILIAVFFPIVIWLFGAGLAGVFKDMMTLEFWVIFAVFCYALTIFAPSKKAE